MQGCGPVTLPSAADLDGAPQEIKDRLNAIPSIDLSEDTVGFKVTGDALQSTPARRPAALKQKP